MPSESLHLAVHVDRPVAVVYAFASDPRRLPQWAPGLCTAVEDNGDGRWLVTSGTERLVVDWAPPNPFGVLDHLVTLPDGEVVHNPVRVVPHDGGSEVVFTLRRRDGMSDEEFARDAAAVTADLERLRDLLESRPA